MKNNSQKTIEEQMDYWLYKECCINITERWIKHLFFERDIYNVNITENTYVEQFMTNILIYQLLQYSYPQNPKACYSKLKYHKSKSESELYDNVFYENSKTIANKFNVFENLDNYNVRLKIPIRLHGKFEEEIKEESILNKIAKLSNIDSNLFDNSFSYIKNNIGVFEYALSNNSSFIKMEVFNPKETENYKEACKKIKVEKFRGDHIIKHERKITFD